MSVKVVFVLELEALLQILDHIIPILRHPARSSSQRLPLFSVHISYNICSGFSFRHKINCIVLVFFARRLWILNLSFLRAGFHFFWLFDSGLCFYCWVLDFGFFFLSVHAEK